MPTDSKSGPTGSKESEPKQPEPEPKEAEDQVEGKKKASGLGDSISKSKGSLQEEKKTEKRPNTIHKQF